MRKRSRVASRRCPGRPMITKKRYTNLGVLLLLLLFLIVIFKLHFRALLRKNFYAKVKSIYATLCCLHNIKNKDLKRYVSINHRLAVYNYISCFYRNHFHSLRSRAWPGDHITSPTKTSTTCTLVPSSPITTHPTSRATIAPMMPPAAASSQSE